MQWVLARTNSPIGSLSRSLASASHTTVCEYVWVLQHGALGQQVLHMHNHPSPASRHPLPGMGACLCSAARSIGQAAEATRAGFRAQALGCWRWAQGPAPWWRWQPCATAAASQPLMAVLQPCICCCAISASMPGVRSIVRAAQWSAFFWAFVKRADGTGCELAALAAMHAVHHARHAMCFDRQHSDGNHGLVPFVYKLCNSRPVRLLVCAEASTYASIPAM